MVPWAPLSFTVLALASMWRCSCSPSRVLGFACTNTEFTRVRHRLRHAGLRAQNELCAPLPSWEGFIRALGKRMVPWAPLSFTVLALASMWRCSCPPSRVLGFACTNTEFYESAPPLAPRWVESTKRVVRAPAKLGRLHPCPRQANGALGSALLHRAGVGFDVALLVSTARVLGFACTNTEFTRVRHRLRHAGLRAQNELCAPLPSWEGFTRALGKRMVPWAPLSFTVLALASMWRCSCPPSRVLGFACTNTEFTRVRHRLRHAGLRAQNELCAPLPSWEGFTRALGKRMVPWAPLSFTVLALASMWRCSCSPSRVLGFACTNTEFYESAPPLAPRWVESTKRVVRAPAKLGRLHPCPRQANGALGSALLHRAGAGFDVALLVSAVACTGFRVHQHRIHESAPPLAPRWVESTKRVVRAPAKLGRLHSCPRQANGALGSALLHRAGVGFDVALLVSTVACTGFRVHQHRILRECATACATLG